MGYTERSRIKSPTEIIRGYRRLRGFNSDKLFPRITQMAQMEKRDPRTYSIIGAAMAVHGELGNGFLEAVYQEAFAIELFHREVPFRKEIKIPIKFKGQTLAAFYVADFICFDEVIVELKAKKSLTGEDDSQAINYLKATGLKLGLLINFGQPSLQYRRLIF